MLGFSFLVQVCMHSLHASLICEPKLHAEGQGFYFILLQLPLIMPVGVPPGQKCVCVCGENLWCSSWVPAWNWQTHSFSQFRLQHLSNLAYIFILGLYFQLLPLFFFCIIQNMRSSDYLIPSISLSKPQPCSLCSLF